MNPPCHQAQGQPFDPLVHDAIMQEYNSDVPDGTVLLCLQKGYRLIPQPFTATSSSEESDSSSQSEGVDQGGGQKEETRPSPLLIRPSLVKVSTK